MKSNCLALISFMLLIVSAACTKTDGTSGGSQPAPVGPTKYAEQLPAISQNLDLASPWSKLAADSVYTSFNTGSVLGRALPSGFADKIVSVYIPKGYMAVFAENEDGTGETITFTAPVSEIRANLPARLRNNISFIRFIKLNNPDKKGTCNTNDTVVQNFGDQWYYGWSLNKPSFNNQQFVPMTWGKGSCTDVNAKTMIERPDVDHLLSFNEPDNTGQSNIQSIDTAVARYKIMQKTGLRLGSPVVTQDHAFGAGKWLTNFMAAANAQKLRVDYICVHWYDWGNQTNDGANDSLTAVKVLNRFTAYLQNVRNAYPTLPIWVTEYNANINRNSEAVHTIFMKLSAQWMNTSSYVERYSYFFPSTMPGINGNKTLAASGTYWKNLPSTKAFTANSMEDATAAN